MVIKQKGEKPKQLSTVSTPDTLPYLGIEAVEKGEIKQYADQYSTVHSTEQDIFVVADGARNGLILKGKKGAVGSTLFCLTPLWINTDYLYYFLKLNEIQRKDTRHVENTFWDIPVPIISLEKQKQITNNINEALSVFEEQNKEAEFKLVKSLKSLVNTNSDVLENIQNLDDFKKAVLDLAVSGGLTEDWRNSKKLGKENLLNQIRIERKKWIEEEILKGNLEARRLENKINEHNYTIPKSKLPETWIYSSLLDCCQLIIDSINKTPEYSKNGILVLRTSNIKFGEITLEDSKYVNEAIYKKWVSRIEPKEGDVVFTREAPIGNAAIIPKNLKLCLGQRTVLLRFFKHLIDVRFILYYILSSKFQKELKDISTGTGVKHLKVSDFERLIITLPKFKEQIQISDNIENIFKMSEKANYDYELEKKRIEELQKAVLSSFYKDLTFDGDIEYILSEIEDARSKKELEIANIRKKQKQFRDKLSTQPKMDIIDILKSSNSPMFINDLWGKSKYNGNIDAFYEALKQEFESNTINWELMNESSEVPQSHISLNHLPA